MSVVKARHQTDEDEPRVRSRKLLGCSTGSRGLEVVRSVAVLFSTFTRPWYVAGGWALDLFASRESTTTSMWRYFGRTSTSYGTISKDGGSSGADA